MELFWCSYGVFFNLKKQWWSLLSKQAVYLLPQTVLFGMTMLTMVGLECCNHAGLRNKQKSGLSYWTNCTVRRDVRQAPNYGSPHVGHFMLKNLSNISSQLYRIDPEIAKKSLCLLQIDWFIFFVYPYFLLSEQTTWSLLCVFLVYGAVHSYKEEVCVIVCHSGFVTRKKKAASEAV